MSSVERSIPEWAKQERARDLTWVAENLHVLWPAAEKGYRDMGRGAIVVDTTSRPTGAGHPFLYLPETGIERMRDPDALRIVKAYDPTWEMVAMLLKDSKHTSTYRIGVPAHKR